MFRGTLYPTQKEGAAFLANKKKTLLAWEQGTGKTVISLAVVNRLIELGKAKNVLILCPTSIAWQWEEKIKEFTDLSVWRVQARQEASRSYQEASTRSVCILPYSVFRRDYDLCIQCKWDIVICDEAQEFKNNKSKTAKLVKRFNLDTKPSYKFALTGTAISNHLEELYSIMYWVDRDFLPPWPSFEKHHIDRSPLGWIKGYKNLDELNKYLTKRVHRKTHDDMKGELPELVENVHTIEKSKFYLEAEEVLLAHLNRLADDFVLDSKGNIRTKDPEVARAFAKVKNALVGPNKWHEAYALAREGLDENQSNRIVIFSHLKQPLYDLYEYFKFQSNTNCEVYTGDQSEEEKQEAIKAFKNDSRILLSSDAGSTGLDLPFANRIIHLDIPFSYGTLDQRNKRITRASSEFKTAVVNYIIMEDSIEEYYLAIVRNKEKLAKAVLEGKGDEVVIKSESLRQFLK